MAWMDLEPDPFGCKFDALLIQDYNSKSEKEKYCGTKPYFPIVSKGLGSEATSKISDIQI